MPQRVQVNSGGLGTVEFPEMMPAHEMASHINRHLANRGIASTGPEMHAPTSGDIQANLPGSAIRPQTWWERISGDVQESPAGRLFKAAADIQDRLRGTTSDVLNTQLPYLGGMTVGDVNDLANAMTVFHGSPHTFEKFDASKIGTGEGAQAYGHGLYFAENPEVAMDYQRRLSTPGTPGYLGAPAHTHALEAERYVQSQGLTGRDAVAAAKQYLNQKAKSADNSWYRQSWYDAANNYEELVNRRGNLYMTEIPDEQAAKMLDWDKPLRDQPASVRQAVGSAFGDVRPAKRGDGRYTVTLVRPDGSGRILHEIREATPEAAMQAFDRWLGDYTGEGIQQTLMAEMWNGQRATRGASAEAVSKRLNELGVPGIKYLDQASRRSFQLLAPNETVHGQWLVKELPNGDVLYRGTDEAAARAALAQQQAKRTRNFVIFDPAILGEVTRK